VAANTAYADFPRLAALIGKDAYLPKQFASQGDRLVFSNGIIILTVVSCFLVWLLHANTDLLLPLYALGVFTGFTISQAGMVMHWVRLRGEEPRWLGKAFINGVGTLASGIVWLDIAVTKFTHGAWIVVLLIPLMVFTFLNIHRYYIRVKARLATSRLDAVLPSKHHALILVSSLHKGVVQALRYGRLISGDRVEALTVDLGSEGVLRHGRSPALRAQPLPPHRGTHPGGDRSLPVGRAGCVPHRDPARVRGGPLVGAPTPRPDGPAHQGSADAEARRDRHLRPHAPAALRAF